MMWACFHEVGNVPRVYEIWNIFLRIGASSGAHVLRTIARAFEFGGVKLEKGLANFTCGGLNG